MKPYIKCPPAVRAGILSAIAVILLFCCLPMLVHAQPNPMCPPTDPNCVPIDGGLSFLIAAGVGYGIKKVRDGRKKDQLQEVK